MLKKFFLSYGQKDGSSERQILKNLKGWSSFRASSNDQLISIRELDLFVARSDIEGDDRMPAQEKAARLAEIDAKRAALGSQH